MQQKRHDEASLISKEVLETRKADAEVAQGQYAEVLAGHYDAFGHCVFATDKNYYKALYYFEQGRVLRSGSVILSCSTSLTRIPAWPWGTRSVGSGSAVL